MRLKFYITLFFAILFYASSAQTGIIRGSVYDASNGEYLPGVTIVVEGTTTGTITDLDGKFNIIIEPGTYNLRMSFISYEPVVVENVSVTADETTLLDEMGLEQATIEIEGVTVTAQAVRNTETALIAVKMKSANLLDGISAMNLRKIGDSDAAASMKRVPGISVSGGKYVYVRGLGDRYTKTILNGMDIPGLDPDRNTIQMDIFPTNVIDNIIVHKSFTADLPADFTGGVIDIAIKDFPEEKKGSVSFGLGYNPEFHFNSNYLTYEGGNTDFLGFDDGTRAIPVEDDIPEFVETFSSTERTDRYREVLDSFNPTMSTLTQTSLMDFSLGASFGNQIPKDKVTLGYNFAASYKNSTDFYENAIDARYGLQGDPAVYEMEVREYQEGSYGVNNAFLSGLAGFAVKTDKSKFRLNLLHLQNGESKAGVFDFEGSDQGSDFISKQHNLDYSQRSLTNLLLDGKHNYRDAKWEIVWKISPTFSRLNDPDIRFSRYEIRTGVPTIGTEVGFPERIWRELKELNFANAVHATKEFQFLGEKNKLKFGAAYTYKQRDFSIRKFLLNIRGGDGILPLEGDPDELLSEEVKWPYQGNPIYGTTYEKDFSESNVFNANVNYIASYVSTELSLNEKLKSILGVRVESFTQLYTGQNQQGTKVLDNDKVLEGVDLFPSVNFIYNLTEKQNLRLSYSKTIARPSMKELSYAEIYDPISGRTFIGGLHEEMDFVNDVTYWDGNLKSTDIQNFDIRWEWFFEKAQMFSLSGFYKKFKNPIEYVQFASQIGAFQPRNVGDGEVYGAETEFRVNLENLSAATRNFAFMFNLTLTKSRVKLSQTEFASRFDNAREGQSIDEYRDMAGQAPIIINSGISYNGGEEGFWNGLEAGFYYNVQGTTLEYVGIVDRPDIYTKAFHSLNFNSNKRFGKDKRYRIGLKVTNILNDDKESIFRSFKAEDQYYSRLHPGFSVSMSFSYAL